MIKRLASLIQKAQHSTFNLWLLNRVMRYAVPFNKPHGFKVVEITTDHLSTWAPYHKKNFNHVRGIHACAIATIGELSAGLLLMYHFSPAEYRFILSHLEIDYHYQAKKDITSTAHLSVDDKTTILKTLETSDKTSQCVISKIMDSDQQPVATVKTIWQIKSWKNVKTKV